MTKLIRNNQKGFTLIELMIVVAIIGILAAIAIPNFLTYQLKSKTAEAKTNLGGIRTGEEAYNAEHDTYLDASALPLAVGKAKVGWSDTAGSFAAIGFEPAGSVYYQYGVSINSAGDAFTATAAGDVDGDSASASYTLDQTGELLGPDPVSNF
ncbi:MAG: prepilin-type N-terminal cleavage/methylation domain-containing protein [Desulfobacter postgatei]|uniref:type IV pilin protein n=1 Tax=Desulfobacter postgatei TaxID=2293 RepID=UPI0023F1968B|nr:prepilin-type N-terminal cleavage/methylation domain-containing protein [Desulfobacter postgatei]MDD4273986.1 prepilin-type N-terminal cleavage/methylation domain-containing protein [Desulfobacter postgatei]